MKRVQKLKISLFLITCILLINLQLGSAEWINTQFSKLDDYYPFPKKVWVFWSENTPMNQVHGQFFKNLQQFMQKDQNKQWSLTLINESNLHKYLTKIDEYNDIVRKNNQAPLAKRSDLIRLFILEEHGGIYVDMTSLFIQDLSWLSLKNLINNPQVINKHPISSPQPEILLFYTSKHQFRNNYLDQYDNLKNNFPGYQSWFIACKSNTSLIKQWRLKFVQYFSKEMKNIFYELWINDIYVEGFPYQNYHSVYYALYFIIQQKQKQLDTNANILSRDNAQYYYKIWTINCDTGPCTTYALNLLWNTQFLHNFFHQPQKQIAQSFGHSEVRYFVKFINFDVLRIDQILKFSRNSQIHKKNLIETYEINKVHSPSKQQLIFINQESFISNRFLKKYKNNQQIRIFSKTQVDDFKKYYQKQSNVPQIVISFGLFVHFLGDELTLLYRQVLIGILVGIIILLILVKQIYNWVLLTQPRVYYSAPQCYQKLDLITYLALTANSMIQKSVKHRIPYIVIGLSYNIIAVYYMLKFQIFNYKQQYQSVFLIIIITLFLKRFGQIHHSINKHNKIQINCIFEQTLYFCLTKLLMDLIFNQASFTHFATFYVLIITLTPIRLFQNYSKIQSDILIVRKLARFSILIHKNLLILSFGLITFLPNIRFYMIGNDYIMFTLFKGLIFYSWLIIALIFIKELVTWLYDKYIDRIKYQPNQKYFKDSVIIVVRYLLVLVFYLFVINYWHKFFHIQYAINILLSFVLVFAANGIPYRNNHSKSSYIPHHIIFVVLLIYLILDRDKQPQDSAEIVIWENYYSLFFNLIKVTAAFKILFRIAGEIYHSRKAKIA